MNYKVRYITVSSFVTIFILYILLSNISVQSLWQVTKKLPKELLVVVFLFHLSAYVLRSYVFYLFLKKEKQIMFAYLLNIHFIHNFYVQTIPFSLGEFSFPILLRNRIKPEKIIPVVFVSRMLFLLLTILFFLFATVLNFEIINHMRPNLSECLPFSLFIVAFLLIYYYSVINNKED